MSLKLLRKKTTKLLTNKIKDVLKTLFEFTSNEKLEDILESLAEANGDHFTNYLIVEKRED